MGTIITEDGKLIITEDDDQIVTEDHVSSLGTRSLLFVGT